MNYFLVFIGGGAGSMFRYFIGQMVFRAGTGLPFGTLIANIFACAIFAAVTFLMRERGLMNSTVTLLVLTGFCGGLSTFSAFGFETYQLLRTGQFAFAGLNMIVSVGICLSIFYSILRN